jgi:hypothetical protein
MNRLTLALLGFILVACLGSSFADDPVDDKSRAAAFLELAKSEAASYAFEDATGAHLALRGEPVLAWSNPVVGSIYGDVFVWTSKGRPEVVGSFYKWYSPFTHRTNEFVSLATGPIVAVRDGDRVWSPSRAGVELKPVPEAPTPADSPAARLRQMRALAAEFAARETDRQNVDRDLRLLSQPIYRYEKTEGDLLDGALFAFALGTDPEALLVLEDRVVDGAPRWHYALARMNGIAMRTTFKGREVWSLPTLAFGATNVRSEPYTSFVFGRVERAPAVKP